MLKSQETDHGMKYQRHNLYIISLVLVYESQFGQDYSPMRNIDIGSTLCN